MGCSQDEKDGLLKGGTARNVVPDRPHPLV